MPIIEVDIIVVNWNSGFKTIEAIRPYLNYQSSYIKCNVIVVDNASADNSINILKSTYCRLIESDVNLGFGRACNLAHKYSKGDYILLLNPDTLSHPEILNSLIFFMEGNRHIGITGPRQFNTKNEIMRSCGRFPTFQNSVTELFGLSKLFPLLFKPNHVMKDWDHSHSKIVDHVMGSYMLLRKSVINEVGFMDEDYFVYMEDIDLSKRINSFGLKCYYNADVSIIHEGGGTGEKNSDLRLFYFISSRRIYWKKQLSKSSVVILTLLSFSVEPLLRIAESLLGRNETSVRSIIKAYTNYFKKLYSST